MQKTETTIISIGFCLLAIPAFADDAKIYDCAKPYHIMEISNGYQSFKEVEVSVGKCKIVEDIEAEETTRKIEDRRDELWEALQTRALTQKEMKEARRIGKYINISPMQPYMEIDKQKERDEAWLQQARLQAIKEWKILP